MPSPIKSRAAVSEALRQRSIVASFLASEGIAAPALTDNVVPLLYTIIVKRDVLNHDEKLLVSTVAARTLQRQKQGLAASRSGASRKSDERAEDALQLLRALAHAETPAFATDAAEPGSPSFGSLGIHGGGSRGSSAPVVMEAEHAVVTVAAEDETSSPSLDGGSGRSGAPVPMEMELPFADAAAAETSASLRITMPRALITKERSDAHSDKDRRVMRLIRNVIHLTYLEDIFETEVDENPAMRSRMISKYFGDKQPLLEALAELGKILNVSKSSWRRYVYPLVQAAFEEAGIESEQCPKHEDRAELVIKAMGSLSDPRVFQAMRSLIVKGDNVDVLEDVEAAGAAPDSAVSAASATATAKLPPGKAIEQNATVTSVRTENSDAIGVAPVMMYDVRTAGGSVIVDLPRHRLRLKQHRIATKSGTSIGISSCGVKLWWSIHLTPPYFDMLEKDKMERLDRLGESASARTLGAPYSWHMDATTASRSKRHGFHEIAESELHAMWLGALSDSPKELLVLHVNWGSDTSLPFQLHAAAPLQRAFAVGSCCEGSWCTTDVDRYVVGDVVFSTSWELADSATAVAFEATVVAIDAESEGDGAEESKSAPSAAAPTAVPPVYTIRFKDGEEQSGVRIDQLVSVTKVPLMRVHDPRLIAFVPDMKCLNSVAGSGTARSNTPLASSNVTKSLQAAYDNMSCSLICHGAANISLEFRDTIVSDTTPRTAEARASRKKYYNSYSRPLLKQGSTFATHEMMVHGGFHSWANIGTHILKRVILPTIGSRSFTCPKFCHHLRGCCGHNFFLKISAQLGYEVKNQIGSSSRAMRHPGFIRPLCAPYGCPQCKLKIEDPIDADLANDFIILIQLMAEARVVMTDWRFFEWYVDVSSALIHAITCMLVNDAGSSAASPSLLRALSHHAIVLEYLKKEGITFALLSETGAENLHLYAKAAWLASDRANWRYF